MEVLFVFLKWVASFSHVDEETGSKMDLQNLATVICPSILYAKGRDAAREDSFTAIPVITQLLEEQDEFYTVPDDFLGILHDQEYFVNCMDMPTKDVLKKVDTYLRLKQSGRGYHGQTPNGGPSMQGGPSQMNGRGDGGEAKLMSQRSDPALSRGRSPMPNGEGLRHPPPLRLPNHSRSRERAPQQNDPRLPPHPGLHQAFSNPGPPSPRQQKEPQWPTSAPRPGNNRGTSSRPSSMVRSNGENYPPNGRNSPGRY